jgi:hypothetical protein
MDVTFIIQRPLFFHFRIKGFQQMFDENYWERKKSDALLKCIKGEMIYSVCNVPECIIPWMTFDWHPAKKPYDI